MLAAQSWERDKDTAQKPRGRGEQGATHLRTLHPPAVCCNALVHRSRLAHWLDGSGARRVTDSLLHAPVDGESRLRAGRGLKLRRPLLPLGVETDLQRVLADLVDAQYDPLVRTLRRIQGLR